jgi:hypothetical protein
MGIGESIDGGRFRVHHEALSLTMPTHLIQRSM